jgi:carbon-monoxide dehydrogenase medium subunit
LREVAPAIADLAGEIGDVQVRNRGTIGGSLAHADPAADMGALLLCYDTTIEAASASGTRTVPLEEFFFGMFMTELTESELLTAVSVSLPASPFGGAYEKYEIRQGGFSTVGVGATAELSADGEQYESITIGLANCGDMPIAVTVDGAPLAGEPVDSDTVRDHVTDQVTQAADPIDDEYSSAEYKERVAGRLASRCLDTATKRAQEATNVD